jgi:hypothetical protein
MMEQHVTRVSEAGEEAVGKGLVFYREYLPDRAHVILAKEKLSF